MLEKETGDCSGVQVFSLVRLGFEASSVPPFLSSSGLSHREAGEKQVSGHEPGPSEVHGRRLGPEPGPSEEV